MRTSYLAAAAAAMSLAQAVAIKRRDSPTYESAVYWGQNGNEQPLAHYCQDDTFDIIILSFLSDFGNGVYPHGTIGSAEEECPIDEHGNGSNCGQLIGDIQTCKAAGKKLFISIGGGTSNWSLTSYNDAKGVADSLWNGYGNPAVTNSAYPRPFGSSVFLDGFDIDLEVDNGSQEYLADLVNELRSNFETDPDNTYYVSGAPQCVIPDANMGNAITSSQFDYLFIQFYDNNCSAGDLVNGSGNPNGDGSFNFGSWPGYISGTPSSGAKLHVGIPAATTSAYAYDYIPSADLPQVLQASTGVAGFNGFMLYDAGDSDHTLSDGCSYGQEVRSVLDTGATGTC